MTKTVALCTWTDDEVLVPVAGVRKRLAALMVVGATYRVEADEYKPRSWNSHKYFFASLNDLYLTLPERYDGEFPTVEHFRKRLLIKRGFARCKDYVAKTEDAAASVAAFVSTLDEYAVVLVEGRVVRVFTAMSQAEDFMDAAAFQKSKEAVLEEAKAMVEIKPKVLA